MDKCECTMSISILGDGCRYCRPQDTIGRYGDIIEEIESELELLESEREELESKLEELEKERNDIKGKTSTS